MAAAALPSLTLVVILRLIAGTGLSGETLGGGAIRSDITPDDCRGRCGITLALLLALFALRLAFDPKTHRKRLEDVEREAVRDEVLKARVRLAS